MGKGVGPVWTQGIVFKITVRKNKWGPALSHTVLSCLPLGLLERITMFTLQKYQPQHHYILQDVKDSILKLSSNFKIWWKATECDKISC